MARKFASVLGMLLLVGAVLPVIQQNAFAMPDPAITITQLPVEKTLNEGDIIYVDKMDKRVQLRITASPPSSMVTMSRFPGATFETIAGGYRFTWPVDSVVVSDPDKPVMYGVTFTAKRGSEVATKNIMIGVEQNLRASLSLDRTGYSPGENATIIVRDPHANRNALAVDTTVAEVWYSGAGIAKADVTLTESPGNPNVFVGEFAVQNGNKLTVRYGNASPVSADIGRFMTLDRSVYHVGEKAKFTLHDDLMNLNLAETDTVQFRISSGAQTITIEVSETSASSGTFEGEVQLGSGSDASLPVLQLPQGSGMLGDRIEVAAGEHVAKASVIEPGFEINHAVSATGDTDMATFTLKDRTLNADSKTREEVQVNVQSGASSIVNTLVETGPDTGVFRSTNKIVLTSDSALASASPQNSLVVQNGRITAAHPAIASAPAIFAVEISSSPVIPASIGPAISPSIGAIGTSVSPLAADPIFPGIAILECDPVDTDGDGLPDGVDDLDKDGICDAWENGGYLDIPFGGATHTFHSSCTPQCPDNLAKDVFVEIDYDSAYLPNPLALDYVMDKFNSAPVQNPGTSGIRLHTILSDPVQNLPASVYVWTKRAIPPETEQVDSYTEIKEQWFGISDPSPAIGFHLGNQPDKTKAWAQVAHYVLWMNKQQNDPGSSGRAEIIGNDMIVSLGNFLPYPTAVDKQQGTYMHELGHNLGLGHGGALVHPDNSINCKPNYLSVMSYMRQMTNYIGSGQDYSRGTWPATPELTIGNLGEVFAPNTLPNADIVYGINVANPVTVAPTSQFRFDGDLNDAVRLNNLVPHGNPSPEYGSGGLFGNYVPFGNYIVFDRAAKQYVQAANTGVFDIAMQDFSYVFVLYRNEEINTAEFVVSKRHAQLGTNPGYNTRIGSTGLLVSDISDGTAATLTSDIAIARDVFYIVGVSHDRDGQMTQFIYDTSNRNLHQKSIPIGDSDGSLLNGQLFTLAKRDYADSGYLSGKMDMFLFYDGTALSQEQFTQIVNQYVYATSEYRFDNNVIDSVRLNNLVPRGSPTPNFGSDGPFGNYIIFNPNRTEQQYVQAANTGVFDIAMQDFSYVFVLYRNEEINTAEFVVSKRAAQLNANPGYNTRIGSLGTLVSDISDGTLATLTSDITISSGWYIVGVSHDRDGQMTQFIYDVDDDNLVEKSIPITGSDGSLLNGQLFTLAKRDYADSGYISGSMDRFMFFDGTAITLDQFTQIVNQYLYGIGSTPVVAKIDGSTHWIDWNGSGSPDAATNNITDIGIVGCDPSSNHFDFTIPLSDHNDWQDIVAIPASETSSTLDFRSRNPAAVTTGSSLQTRGVSTEDVKGFREFGIRAIDSAIQSVDDNYFSGNATLIKADYHKDLIQGSNNILSLVRSDDIQKAIARLEKIRETMDELEGGNPADDKIEKGGQGGVLPVLDNNIAALKLELDEPYKAPHTFQVKSYSGNKVYTINGNSTTITAAVNTFTFNNATKTIDLDLIGSGDVLLEIPSELVKTVTEVSNGRTSLTFTYTSPSPTVKVLVEDLPYYPRSTTVSAGGIVPPKNPLSVSPTQNIGPGKELIVTVSDCDINASIGLDDTVAGKVTVLTDRGSSANLTIRETGASTCVFVGTITLNPDNNAGSAGSGTRHVTINAVPGDVVAVRYPYVEAGVNKITSRTFAVGSEDPTMETGATIYTAGDIIGLTVTDFDANLDSTLFDSIEVRVTSDSDAVGFDVMAVEAGRDSGRFVVAVPTSTSSSSGSITVNTGDKVYFEYTDRFPADYADRLGNLADPSEDFLLEVPIAPDGATSTTPSTPQPEDATGNILDEIPVGTQVIISSTITNNANVAQPFAAVAEVRDADGITVFLTWQTGVLPANGHTDVGLSWTPAAPGDYTVKVFVIDSIASTSPTVLSPIAQSTFTVSAAVPMNLPPMSPPSGTIVEP